MKKFSNDSRFSTKNVLRGHFDVFWNKITIMRKLINIYRTSSPPTVKYRLESTVMVTFMILFGLVSEILSMLRRNISSLLNLWDSNLLYRFESEGWEYNNISHVWVKHEKYK